MINGEDGLYEITWASPTCHGMSVVGNASDASAWVATFRRMGAVSVSVTRYGVRIDFPDPVPPVNGGAAEP